MGDYENVNPADIRYWGEPETAEEKENVKEEAEMREELPFDPVERVVTRPDEQQPLGGPARTEEPRNENA